MQTYLPLIQTMLTEWYLFTLNNALYAAALATAVWLLSAILYSFRIAAIKRDHVAIEKACNESLTTAQHQLQHTQEELASTILLMEKATSAAQDETQRTLTLEQLIYQRNKQIAETIQTLATSFDLGERPLLASEDVKADLLWQQHTKVISQLIERLRTEHQAKIELQQTCQAETAKLAEKDVLLEALQTTLDTHADQLANLELALADQKAILQQQDNAQQALSNTLKNYQVASTHPATPEPAVNTWQQPLKASPPENPVAAQTTFYNPVAQVNEKAHAAVSWQDDLTTVEVVPTAEVAAPAITVINPQAVTEEEPYVSLDIEQQPVIPSKGSFGKIKNLFGKTKEQPVKTEPQWAITKPEEQLPSTTEQQTEDEVSGKAEKTPGKLQGFYSKFKSKGK